MSEKGGRRGKKRTASPIEGAASAIESGSTKSQWKIHSPVSFTYCPSNGKEITHNIEGKFF